jgi:hypothetical protein
VISEITERVRPEIKFLTQRSANPVLPEIEFQNSAACVKIGPAVFLKTGVFCQALIINDVSI